MKRNCKLHHLYKREIFSGKNSLKSVDDMFDNFDGKLFPIFILEK